MQRLLRDHRNSQEVLAVPRQRAPQALALLDRNARLGLAIHHSAQNPSGSRASGQAGGWPPSGVNCGSKMTTAKKTPAAWLPFMSSKSQASAG